MQKNSLSSNLRQPVGACQHACAHDLQTPKRDIALLIDSALRSLFPQQ